MGELLDVVYGDDGCGLVDYDWIVNCFSCGEILGVWVSVECGEFVVKWNDFGECCGVVCVGDVVVVCGVYYVIVVLEVVEGVVDGNGVDVVFIGEFDGFFYCVICGGLVEFFVGVLNFGGFEF